MLSIHRWKMNMSRVANQLHVRPQNNFPAILATAKAPFAVISWTSADTKTDTKRVKKGYFWLSRISLNSQ